MVLWDVPYILEIHSEIFVDEINDILDLPHTSLEWELRKLVGLGNKLDISWGFLTLGDKHMGISYIILYFSVCVYFSIIKSKTGRKWRV